MNNINNLNDAINRDLNHLGLGISLIKEKLKGLEIQNLDSLDPEIKNLIHTVYTSGRLLGESYIGDILEKETKDKSNKLKEANNKIYELERKIGQNVEAEHISSKLKEISTEMKKLFNSYGVNGSFSVSANEQSFIVKIKFIKSFLEDTKYCTDEKEIIKIQEENNKNIVKFNYYFEGCSKNKKIKLSELNIKTLNDIIKDTNFKISNIETELFSDDNESIIDSLTLEQDLNNFVIPTFRFA